MSQPKPPLSPQAVTDLTGLLMIVGAYAVSFFLPAVEWVAGFPEPGWQAFRSAKMIYDPPNLTTVWADRAWLLLWWSPNLLLGAGVVLLLKGWRRTAAVCGAAAVVLGLTCGLDPDSFAIDYRKFRIGYYLWLSSMALLAVFSGTGAYRRVGLNADNSSTR